MQHPADAVVAAVGKRHAPHCCNVAAMSICFVRSRNRQVSSQPRIQAQVSVIRWAPVSSYRSLQDPCGWVESQASMNRSECKGWSPELFLVASGFRAPGHPFCRALGRKHGFGAFAEEACCAFHAGSRGALPDADDGVSGRDRLAARQSADCFHCVRVAGKSAPALGPGEDA